MGEQNSRVLDLAGKWIYRQRAEEGEMELPGRPGRDGAASYSRILYTKDFPEHWREGRIFLFLERAGKAEAFLGDRPVPALREGTPVSPSVLELTGLFGESDARAVLTVAADHGIGGRICLFFSKKTFLADPAAIPDGEGVLVRLVIEAGSDYRGEIQVTSKALKSPIRTRISCRAGRHILRIRIPKSALLEDAPRWDLLSGKLGELAVTADGLDPVTCTLGLRDFHAENGHLVLNGRRVFLRGEEIGTQTPASGSTWRDVFRTITACGINFVRFAGNIPCEAALDAADRAGVLVMAELPVREKAQAFREDDAYELAERELSEALPALMGHPSFAMLALGTGLSFEGSGLSRGLSLLSMARRMDPTRLYALTSNPGNGHSLPDPEDDFCMLSAVGNEPLRGTIEGRSGRIAREVPSLIASYDRALQELRKHFSGPVLSMGACAYGILPALPEETSTDPADRIFAGMIKAAGLKDRWEILRGAAGELSFLLRKEEADMAFRTRDLSGFCFQGLADGGKKTTGILDAHFARKPGEFTEPSRFAKFLTDVRPMLLTAKRCCREGETVSVRAGVLNASAEEIRGSWKILVRDERNHILLTLPGAEEAVCPAGKFTVLGDEMIPLENNHRAKALTIELCVADYSAREKIWIYPVYEENYTEVTVTENLGEAKTALEMGASVLLVPPATPYHFPNSCALSFVPWSGEFTQAQKDEQTLGILTDRKHRIYRDFETRDHADWQWWGILRNARAMVLPREIPDEASLIDVIDGPKGMRRLSALLELRVGKGKLLICSLGLWQKGENPEARALLHGILEYVQSDAFHPAAEASLDLVEKLVD